MEQVNYDDRLSFPATYKNRLSIASVLSQYIFDNGVLLEIASGSGEHGIFFQDYFPSIVWQTSDPELIHRRSINGWISHKGLSSKMPKPLNIDVNNRPWPISNQIRKLIKGIVCINMVHISPWSCTCALFEESRSILNKNQFLMLYGPFFRKDKRSAKSNLEFDYSLRTENSKWGLRYLENVHEIALKNAFELDKLVEMPANNLSVIYKLK